MCRCLESSEGDLFAPHPLRLRARWNGGLPISRISLRDLNHADADGIGSLLLAFFIRHFECVAHIPTCFFGDDSSIPQVHYDLESRHGEGSCPPPLSKTQQGRMVGSTDIANAVKDDFVLDNNGRVDFGDGWNELLRIGEGHESCRQGESTLVEEGAILAMREPATARFAGQGDVAVVALFYGGLRPHLH